jgi:hypothetical protein
MVVTPLPKFGVVKPEGESDERFITKVAERAEKLVGRYNLKEHEACVAHIPNNGRLNRVFEEAGIEYVARPRPDDTPASAGASKKGKGEALAKPAAKDGGRAPRKPPLLRRLWRSL